MAELDWDTVRDILYNGTESEIRRLRCPDCNGRLEFALTQRFTVLVLKCIGRCGRLVKFNKTNEMPNCVIYFGDRALIR